MDVWIIGYIAGFLDGEGSISISKRNDTRYSIGVRYQMEVNFYNSNYNVLAWIQSYIGGSLHSYQPHQKPYAKVMHDLKLSATSASQLLEILLPYLQIKQHHAKIAILFQETMGEPINEVVGVREELYQKVRELNRKGKGGDNH